MSAPPRSPRAEGSLTLVGERAMSPPGVPEPPPPSAFGVVENLAKLEFDAQFKLAERYDAKVRGTLGLATLLFGIAQAALTRTVGRAHDLERDLVIALAVIAFIALGVSLAAAIWALATTRTAQIKGEYLIDQIEAAQSNNAQAHTDLLTELAGVVGERQQDNKDRSFRMKVSQGASIIALVLIALELVVELIAVASSS